jgi:gamma-tubulin complex component 3
MLEYSQGEIGWDVFTLEYKVDAPLDTILDPEAMAQYLRVFNQLWRLKRTEYAVHAAWQRLLSPLVTRYTPHLAPDFHRARIVLAEMAHFVRQMQYWVHLDVIACQWQTLEDVCAKKQGDLDSLIEAHREYLDNLVNNTLLLLSKPGKEVRLLASSPRSDAMD